METTNWGVDIRIPGDFEHAFLYKGNLLAVNADKEIWSTSVSDLLVASYPLSSPFDPSRILAMELMYGKSFWEIKGYLLNTDLLAAVESPRVVNHPAWSRTVINNPELLKHEILDVTIYFDRLYLSTTGGLFHIDMHSLTAGTNPQSIEAHRRSDAYTFSSTVRYACVVASCGDDGLFAWMDDFGTLGLDGTETHNDRVRSLRTGWMRSGLINYPQNNHADFLPIDVQQVSLPAEAQASDEVTVISDIRGLDFSNQTNLLDHQNGYSSSTQLMFNADSKFAFVDENGSLRFEDRHFANSAFGGTIYNYPEDQASYVGDSYDAFAIIPPPDTALGRKNFDDIRIGVNTASGVYLADSCGIHRISATSAVTCKSFPASRNYRGTVLIVDEDELILRTPRPLHINRQGPRSERCRPYA